MPQTPEQAAQSMIDNLKERTGRSLAEWYAVLGTRDFARHGDFMKFLKGEMGVSHGYANLITLKYRQEREGAPDEDPVAALFAGPKQGLRSIYDRIAETVRRMGDDAEFAPKKTYVSVRRRKQFAIVQPSTRDRVDLGLNLKGAKPSGRLEAAGSFNAMVSHRVRLATPQDVDAEVKAWIKQAYDAAG